MSGAQEELLAAAGEQPSSQCSDTTQLDPSDSQSPHHSAVLGLQKWTALWLGTSSSCLAWPKSPCHFNPHVYSRQNEPRNSTAPHGPWLHRFSPPN